MLLMNLATLFLIKKLIIDMNRQRTNLVEFLAMQGTEGLKIVATLMKMTLNFLNKYKFSISLG